MTRRRCARRPNVTAPMPCWRCMPMRPTASGRASGSCGWATSEQGNAEGADQAALADAVMLAVSNRLAPRYVTRPAPAVTCRCKCRA
jgi:hypothetical protein